MHLFIKNYVKIQKTKNGQKKYLMILKTIIIMSPLFAFNVNLFAILLEGKETYSSLFKISTKV